MIGRRGSNNGKLVRVILGPIREWLLPGDAERDEAFQQEILSLSHPGLNILAIVEIGIALLSLDRLIPLVAASTSAPGRRSRHRSAGRVYKLYPYTRIAGVASCITCSVITARTIPVAHSQDFALGAITVFVLTAAAALPLLPLQSLAGGAAALAAGFDSQHTLFLAMVAVTATAITSALYSQRRNHYLSTSVCSTHRTNSAPCNRDCC